MYMFCEVIYTCSVVVCTSCYYYHHHHHHYYYHYHYYYHHYYYHYYHYYYHYYHHHYELRALTGAYTLHPAVGGLALTAVAAHAVDAVLTVAAGVQGRVQALVHV